MKIYSPNVALYGQKIDVRGTLYTIGTDGSIDGVASEHAEILLQFKGHRLLAGDSVESEVSGEVDPAVEPVVDRWAARLAELESLPARKLMTIGRKLGLKIVGKSGAELALDIVEREKESESLLESVVEE